jgi:hypothetical protein
VAEARKLKRQQKQKKKKIELSPNTNFQTKVIRERDGEIERE